MVWRDLGRDSINMCYDDYEETRPRYVSENSVVLEMERAAFLSSPYLSNELRRRSYQATLQESWSHQ